MGAFYWRMADQRSGKTTKQWSRAESKLYGTLCTREFRVLRCWAKREEEGRGKVRRLGRATYKAVQAKGIKSFRRNFNQDLASWPRLELDKKLIQG